MQSKSTISTKLKQARLNKKYTQKQLSKITGLSNSLISNIECGYRSPRLEHLLLIAGPLEISLDNLLLNPTVINKTFVMNNTKLLREANGWSQYELSKKARISQASVYKIENGLIPDPIIIVRLAKAFCVDVETFKNNENIDLATAVIKRCLLENNIEITDVNSILQVKNLLNSSLRNLVSEC